MYVCVCVWVGVCERVNIKMCMYCYKRARVCAAQRYLCVFESAVSPSRSYTCVTQSCPVEEKKQTRLQMGPNVY